MTEEKKLTLELNELRRKHKDLDDAIDSLNLVSNPNQLEMKRLKKEKLCLRDRIAALESMLLPDIIA